MGFTFRIFFLLIYLFMSNDGNSNQSYVYLSVFMTLLAALFYGFMGVSSKYATHFYDSFTEEYSMIFMMISGLIGSLSIIALLIYQVEIFLKFIISKHIYILNKDVTNNLVIIFILNPLNKSCTWFIINFKYNS